MKRWNRIAAVGMLTTLCGWASAQAMPWWVPAQRSVWAICNGHALRSLHSVAPDITPELLLALENPDEPVPAS